MQIGEPNEHEQTVEQEFSSYAFASCFPVKTDIIKYWEVSYMIYDLLCHLCLVLFS
jgi:hypothetical protein